MKYIVIHDPVVGEFAVFCLAPQTHVQLATAWRRDDGRKVVSAGFCEFLGTGAVVVFGRSEGLNMENRGTKDASLIAAMYHGTVEMARQSDGSASRSNVGVARSISGEVVQTYEWPKNQSAAALFAP